MVVTSKEIKLLTLSLLLRTMPKDEQSLLMGHFSEDVARELARIQNETAGDVEKLDWSPFYKTWPELQKILNDCNNEMKSQRIVKFAEEQRPKFREYILAKLGRQKKGPPVLLSEDVTAVIDDYLENQEMI